MAYIEPVPADLKIRYQAFTAVDDAVITYWLTDAHRFVDTSWIEGDYPVALMAHAAHTMVLRGYGTDAAAEAVRDGTVGFRRIRSGSIDIERLDKSLAQSDDEYATTPYGPEYVALLAKSKGGPRTTSPGHVPYPSYGYPYNGGYPWAF